MDFKEVCKRAFLRQDVYTSLSELVNGACVAPFRWNEFSDSLSGDRLNSIIECSGDSHYIHNINYMFHCCNIWYSEKNGMYAILHVRSCNQQIHSYVLSTPRKN